MTSKDFPAVTALIQAFRSTRGPATCWPLSAFCCVPEAAHHCGAGGTDRLREWPGEQGSANPDAVLGQQSREGR